MYEENAMSRILGLSWSRHRLYLPDVLWAIPVVMAVVSCGGPVDNPAAPSNPALAGETFKDSTSQMHAVRTAGGQATINVCHRTEGTHDFVLISVAAAALDAHRTHGDGLVGEPVPGQPGKRFWSDCTAVSSVPVLDQSNTTFLTFGGAGAPGSAVTSGQTVAQTFTVGVSGSLTTIDLGLYKDPGTIGDVTLEILPFSVFPTFDFSASLYSTTIPITSIPLLTTALTSIDVSAANLSVTSGEQLAIALHRSAGPANSSPWVVWQDSDPASPYPGGSFFVFHPGFTQWLSVSGDHRFQTWVSP
jgi:hypothetical protein